MKYLVATVCILLAMHFVDAGAATVDMHHCIGSSGEPVFSDRPCPNPAPDIDENGASPDAGGQRGTCATSAEEVRVKFASAFARHDAIALSGLFLWRGYGSGSARGLLKDLASLVRQPLLAINIQEGPATRTGLDDDYWVDDRQLSHYGRGQGPPLHETEDPAGPPHARDRERSTTLRIAVDEPGAVAQTRELHFALVDESGCWWLLPE